MDTTKPLLDRALDLAARGWPVFPLRVGDKTPALHGLTDCPGTGVCADEHQGWEQRATTDPERIRAAWAHAPFNIGLATGPAGLCVLDLDVLKDGETVPEAWAGTGVTCGEDVLAALAEQAHQPVPGDTLTVRTPSGGLHLYYRAPDGAALRNTGGERGNGLGWKVDTRSWGGYVVAPGSVTTTGSYDYLCDSDPAPLPDWLAQRLTPAPPPPAPVTPIRPTTGRRSRYVEAAVRAEAAKVHHAPKSQRNGTLYAAALALGQLVAGGALSADEVTSVLLGAARRHIAARAYSEIQARKTITSGLSAGAKRPRQIA
ncbi:bifunctional DNA primase/polymerase [Haloechinothrix sp. YIM 98757]|uniref:Bifunctional DNA primase/polymerase n=1 Tax=Haloechinothrix aidingensis TaxID=2752311 RepID=A0A838ADV2_9PSEU|nr:bifunctional DNA primase/polymerase [Haloechinothrix aidingensis]MBA0127308.1 bifunctional DNA primase/polymerase [Haloechinothrix aidingensis]